MNKVILLILLISLKSYSQNLQLDNFNYENGVFFWQKVYDTELTNENVIHYFKTSGIIKNIEISENSFSGNIENMDLDYKGFGKSEMNTAMYISRSYLNSFILIELKDNKYRITLKEIKLIQQYDDGISRQGEMSDLSEYAVKNNHSDFRNIFKKDPCGILNFTFDKFFIINNMTSEDW